MTNSAEQQVIDLGDEQYAFDSLSDQAKELVNGLQVADAQLQITHDKLNVMTVSYTHLTLPTMS